MMLEKDGKQITTAELVRLFKQSFSKHKQSFKNLDKGVEAVLNDTKTDINMVVIKVDSHGDLEMVAKTVMRKKNFSTSNKKYTFEDANRITKERKVNLLVLINIQTYTQMRTQKARYTV